MAVEARPGWSARHRVQAAALLLIVVALMAFVQGASWRWLAAAFAAATVLLGAAVPR